MMASLLRADQSAMETTHKVTYLAALFIAGFLNGCAWMSAGYISPQLEEYQPAPEKGQSSTRIYFWIPDFHPSASNRRAHFQPEVFQAIQAGLMDNPTFNEAVYSSEPPNRGVFCAVRIEREPRSGLMYLWAFLFGASLGIIPGVDLHGDRITVTYELYIDRTRQKAYRYQIIRKGLIWIGTPLIKPFLPNTWNASLFDETTDRAYRATARAFWREAKHDGLF